MSIGDAKNISAAVEAGQVNRGDKTTSTDSSRDGSQRMIDGIVNNVFWDVESEMKGQYNTTINRYLTSVYELGELKVVPVV